MCLPCVVSSHPARGVPVLNRAVGMIGGGGADASQSTGSQADPDESVEDLTTSTFATRNEAERANDRLHALVGKFFKEHGAADGDVYEVRSISIDFDATNRNYDVIAHCRDVVGWQCYEYDLQRQSQSQHTGRKAGMKAIMPPHELSWGAAEIEPWVRAHEARTGAARARQKQYLGEMTAIAADFTRCPAHDCKNFGLRVQPVGVLCRVVGGANNGLIVFTHEWCPDISGGGRGKCWCKVQAFNNPNRITIQGAKTNLKIIGPKIDKRLCLIDVLFAINPTADSSRVVHLRALHQGAPALLYRQSYTQYTVLFDSGKTKNFTRDEILKEYHEGKIAWLDHTSPASGASEPEPGPESASVPASKKRSSDGDTDDNSWSPAAAGTSADTSDSQSLPDEVDETELLGAIEMEMAETENDDVVPHIDDDGHERKRRTGALNETLLSSVARSMDGLPSVRKGRALSVQRTIADPFNISLPNPLTEAYRTGAPHKGTATMFRRFCIVDPHTFFPDLAPQWGKLKCPHCGECSNVELDGFTDGLRTVVRSSVYSMPTCSRVTCLRYLCTRLTGQCCVGTAIAAARMRPHRAVASRSPSCTTRFSASLIQHFGS